MAFKIYTKTGDQGQTGLFGGSRVSKGAVRIDAYGTVDELNSFLGLLRDQLADQHMRTTLRDIQDRLFTLGAHLASDPSKQMQVPDLLEADIDLLEQEMDRMDEGLPTLRNFLLPGGHPAVSTCHVARCVCRRAERLVVVLHEQEPIEPILIRYLNRLSDYLFVLSRQIAQDLGVEEVPWRPRQT
ncbi:MAG: cob(I)yrinic acid a,c-diamide adenosyltransferase [Saprospiraceae bacterium]|nr:cob(I)yrinic acid a,c-diamide adenosyltransferase [Saprospiraceae bacterium]MCB0679711.1 cob(I)yrinic acid a,c-diamide adenosyltransferase [Saprospiraceae bacterium]